MIEQNTKYSTIIVEVLTPLTEGQIGSNLQGLTRVKYQSAHQVKDAFFVICMDI